MDKVKKGLVVFGTVLLCIAVYNFLSEKTDKLPGLTSLGTGSY